jgi:phosphoglycerol transferase MdoB-like AlkP superfamily enzyme
VSRSAQFEACKGVTKASRIEYESIFEFIHIYYKLHPKMLAVNICLTIVFGAIGVFTWRLWGGVVGIMLGVLLLVFGSPAREKVREIYRRV